MSKKGQNYQTCLLNPCLPSPFLSKSGGSGAWDRTEIDFSRNANVDRPFERNIKAILPLQHAVL